MLTTIVAIKNIIICKKIRGIENILENLVDTYKPAKVAKILSFADLVRRLEQVMSKVNKETAKELGLTKFKN